MNTAKYLFLSIFIFTFLCANAMPAYPGLVDYKQPDGTTVKIYLHGDERMKSAETQDGYTVMNNKKGYLEYAVPNNYGDIVPSGIKAKNADLRDSKAKSMLARMPKHIQYSPSQKAARMKIRRVVEAEQKQYKSFPTVGSRKLICILMNFSDLTMNRPRVDFENLFNQVGYNTEGATGSVHDYFKECSYGRFDLNVTVVGPYTAANPMAYYGKNDIEDTDTLPHHLVSEAILAADVDVNYADFDNDADGKVDGIYVIYAGYGEEAGGGDDCIWAHAWSLPTPKICDGKSVAKYSCSSELSSNKNMNINTIGIICHEFGHVLGAADYYDTDYSKNGDYLGTGKWDLQGGGSWNNGGKTPAHPNAFTKCYTYNWASAKTIASSQSFVLKNSAKDSTSFYRINTPTSGEYFLLENRQKVGFDSKVPGKGMLIYHVDSAYVSSHMSSNDVNNTSHQGMYIMAANSSVSNGVESAVFAINSTGCPFPGTTFNTRFDDTSTPSSLSWQGESTAKPVTNITEDINDSTIHFDFMPLPTLLASSSVKLSMYPNPATTELHVHLSDYSIVRTYSVCDLQGHTRITGVLSEDTRISLHQLNPSVYVLKVNNVDPVLFEKR